MWSGERGEIKRVHSTTTLSKDKRDKYTLGIWAFVASGFDVDFSGLHPFKTMYTTRSES
jgi:hypothetical protein